MKTLYLLRHAKSSWDDPLLDDFDRPLNQRGRQAAEAMAGHLAAQAVSPDLVLCSPAKRTRETLSILQAKMVIGEVRYDERIYESPRDRLVAVLRDAGASPSVMLIGHNPGLERLAALLVGEADPVLLDRMAEKYPTCALAALEAIDGAAPGTPRGYRLVDFLRPADLAGARA